MNKLYDDYDKFPIRYANCWEDSENVLHTAPRGARMLSICSGGDNTLALLLKQPREILAFDTNIYQIYMLQLKVAAIKYLDYDEVLILLGIKDGEAKAIFQKLKNKMEPDAFSFFDQHPEFFEQGLINIGKFEHYFQLFTKYICPLFASHNTLQRFAYMNGIEQQKAFYKSKINNRRLRVVFSIFFGFKTMGKFGRDKNYYDHVPENDKRNNAQDIKRRFDYGVSHIVNNSNPYLHYILLNRFREEYLPTYLQPKNYQIIKNNLSIITYLHGSLLDVVEQYDYFNLSDIFEYMSGTDYQKNLQHLAKISSRDAIVVYYNMQNSRYINEQNGSFRKLTDKSIEGFERNRAYFYRDFLVYQKVDDE